ncbi:ABC transporter substrate-binding protein [Brucella sp. NBRC 12950]|jgi:polar amino acid transport system substrate-binding protein|uniref:ABC transporter substrate-binding protein n=1 Tax=Brucella sp. NBRC 12950 TaxID=2994518 RepID=UPI0024A54AEC|nr:ABC transporter substrate-binding protein [Brucella sp. NBRC 12950]GLU27547.1 ABC transporter substrate-binding protein [Brucella sp. NBRC 12950]
MNIESRLTQRMAAAIVATGLLVMTGPVHAQTASEILPQKYKDAGVLKLVTDAKYPPFQSVNDAGEIVGFEVDLWNAIADRLKVKMDVTSVAFDSLIPGVQSGRWDIAMEGITDNAERQKVVSFVDYGYTTSSAYVLEQNGAGVSDHLGLCGLKGSAQSGTEWVGMITKELGDACVEAGKEKPTVSEFGTSEGTLLSLYSGRSDFVLTSAALAGEISKAAPHPVKVIAMPILPRMPSGIAFRKDEGDLGEALLRALNEVRANGDYEKIYAKWTVSPMAMDHEPGINLATIPGAK